MDKIHIERNSVQETLVIPLYSRKLCTEIFGEFYKDERAVKLIKRLDYEFKDEAKLSKNLMMRFGSLEIGVRQKAFAYEIGEYLKTHPKASIVNLGCGLDQTCEMLDNGTCKIYNVDFEDVIAIRNELIPPTERVTNIACDLNSLEFMEQIDRDNGSIFFASGVFYYFSKDEIKHIFNGMANYFKGGVLVFDTCNKTAVKFMMKNYIKKTGIDGVMTNFYVNKVEDDIEPWLEHAKVTYRPYMTGYFDLHLPCIKGVHRLLARIGDNIMKMRIVKITFDE